MGLENKLIAIQGQAAGFSAVAGLGPTEKNTFSLRKLTNNSLGCCLRIILLSMFCLPVLCVRRRFAGPIEL